MSNRSCSWKQHLQTAPHIHIMILLCTQWEVYSNNDLVPNTGQDIEQLEFGYSAGGNTNLVISLKKKKSTFLINIHLTHDPNIHSGIYTRKENI